MQCCGGGAPPSGCYSSLQAPQLTIKLNRILNLQVIQQWWVCSQRATDFNRDEVCDLTRWCTDNNLTLNIKKIKEITLDPPLWKNKGGHSLLTINGEDVERVSSFKFLETHIWEDLTRSFNTTALVKRAQQRLYFLRTQENQPVCTAAQGLLPLLHRECVTVQYHSTVR